jgi:hypothetical protein
MGLSAVAALKGVASVFGQQAAVEQEGLFKIPDESQSQVEIDLLSEETFSRYVNTRFRVYTSPLTAINLQLIAIIRSASSISQKPATTPKLDCFSVVFRGPRKTALESNTYRVEHDQMGAFDIFITPVDDHKRQRHYQAVFNRVQH